MKFKIFKYKATDNHFDLSPHGMTAWVVEDDWNMFLERNPICSSRPDFYIKIECREPLSEFVCFSQLAKLPNQTRYTSEGDGLIWLPKEIMPQGENTTNKKSELEISIVDNIFDRFIIVSLTSLFIIRSTYRCL